MFRQEKEDPTSILVLFGCREVRKRIIEWGNGKYPTTDTRFVLRFK